jgi:hypothetical protein
MLVFAAIAASCGRNPAGPTTGATINGSIVSASSSASTASVRPAASAMPGVIVSIVGTNISQSVDGSGGFVLRDVPPGQVVLQFTAPGLAVMLGLQGVRSGESITLAVSFDGTSPQIESQHRANGNEEQLEGRVQSLPPTVPAGTLVVAGRQVSTDTNTVFFLNGAPSSFAALAIGQRVHVKGQTAGSSLLASQIHIQNTNADLPVNINGIVSNFTGTFDAFQFEINGQLIKGDALTAFFGNSVFGDLANGVRAEVKGQQADGYVYAARIHVEGPDDDDDDQDESASIEGELTSNTGVVPALTLLVGGTTVLTNAGTEVHRRGDVQDLEALQLGMTLHVVGTRQADSSILARKIQIKADAVGGIFEIEGPMGGRQGACPAISFGVMGYSIVADATTVFVPSCSALANGNRVRVEGIVLAGGSVRATRIEK